MPKYYEFKVAGYFLYFTSFCVVECMHVHASDRKLTESGSAKFFVKGNGDSVLQNRGLLTDREVSKIQAFIKENYEKMYEKETVEDVQISQISKKGYEEMKEYKEKQEAERPVELVDVSDSIGIQVKGDNHRSAGGEYARNYSARMQSSPEVE